MLRARKKAKMPCKPNVIPILDAVFIFIFFLLMSAQFLEIYEIGSDAPAVKTVSDDNKDKKPPLNLTLIVNSSKITVKTGLDGNVYKTVGLKDGDYDYKKLNAVLAEIKAKNIDEESVIIKPSSKVQYKKLVFIMDSARSLENKVPSVVGKNKKGDQVETRDLFKQIIFETII